ncbi:SigE family RNA polymerase sigma factor [Kineosporia rhizophila]|uniref:SigE family RNA polymerase sigma factor n=1 Tax=Kineosporia TaxID=49184 RepID=UPI001E3C9715|nr:MULTISPECIES: SigE family RNA polymerase sigma factor [Kineosporia]MCE0534632.1 SigE family RNA polymerase sigma factor [Kineosporia rhizophila]GLY15577.1 RNA polymerase subunit sigma-24 [Kineosporia sp. NBRC 101677]
MSSSAGTSPGFGDEVPAAPTLSGLDAEAAVEILFDRYQLRMLRVATVLVGDPVLAEDVVQDAFLAVHGSWERIRNKDEAVGYLHRSVINTARSRLRRRSVVQRLAGLRQHDQMSAEDAALKAQLPGPLTAAIAALPRREREVVLLRHYLDLSEKETADALGLRSGSVKGYASRGLAKLRKVLQEEQRPELLQQKSSGKEEPR